MQRVEWKQLREIFGMLRILFWNWTRVNIQGKTKTPTNTLTILVYFNQIWDQHAGGRWRCRDQRLCVDLQRQVECHDYYVLSLLLLFQAKRQVPETVKVLQPDQTPLSAEWHLLGHGYNNVLTSCNGHDTEINIEVFKHDCWKTRKRHSFQGELNNKLIIFPVYWWLH